MDVNFKELNYFVRTDIAVVDRNPEMADMSNPHGDIHGDVDYIIAETPTGRRFAHVVVALTRPNGTLVTSYGSAYDDVTSARLEELAHHLNETKPDLDEAYWNEIDPCYGSEAYIAQGTERTLRYREIEEAVEAGEMTFAEGFNLSLHVAEPL